MSEAKSKQKEEFLSRPRGWRSLGLHERKWESVCLERAAEIRSQGLVGWKQPLVGVSSMVGSHWRVLSSGMKLLTVTLLSRDQTGNVGSKAKAQRSVRVFCLLASHPGERCWQPGQV